MAQVEPARMVTPEAVALEFRTANLGSRILAYLVDMAVVVAGILVGLFAVALLGQASDVVVPDWVALTIVLVLLPAWWLGYFIAFETLWRGRTLGKAALGLRVVTREGAPVRFRHAAIRGLLGLVDFFLFGGFVAVVFILFSRDNQRLGDMVAGTLVLRERSALAAPAPVDFTPPPGLDGLSMTRALRGQAEPTHDFLYWEFHERGFQQAVRMGDWKAIRNRVGGPLELYDLSGDPGEKDDVAAGHPEVVAKVEAYLKTARTESKEWPLRAGKK